MTQKILSEDISMSQRDRMPKFVDHIEFYKKNEKGTDPIKDWFGEEHGYHGRPSAHINPWLVHDLDHAVGDYIVNTEHALRSNLENPRRETVLEHLNLNLETTSAPSGPMFSPRERTLAQRTKAYLAPRMQKVTAWFNNLTSTWFARNPNRFASVRSVRMPKLAKPRVVGEPNLNIKS